MRLTLTSEEFLAAWLLRRGLEPLRADCRIMREDGIDLPGLERTAMEAWFSRPRHGSRCSPTAPATSRFLPAR